MSPPGLCPGNAGVGQGGELVWPGSGEGQWGPRRSPELLL